MTNTPQFQLTGPKAAGDLTERRKELIYCDGYDVTTGVTTFNADPNNQETDVPVFGQDENITGTATTSSNVGLTILEQNAKSNGFMRLLHGLRPSNNPLNYPTQFNAKDLQEVNLLTLRKNNDDDRVIMSRFQAGVSFASAYPEGGAADKAQRAYTGKGSPVREFDGLVTCDLVVSGEAIRYTSATGLAQVPREKSGTYAVHIEALNVPGGDLSSESVEREPVKEVTPDMVSSLGIVSWDKITEAVGLPTVNKAHIYYLLSGVTGIPTTTSGIEPEGMRGVPTT